MLFSESEIKIGSHDMSGCIIRVISFNWVSKGIRDLFGFPYFFTSVIGLENSRYALKLIRHNKTNRYLVACVFPRF